MIIFRHRCSTDARLGLIVGAVFGWILAESLCSCIALHGLGTTLMASAPHSCSVDCIALATLPGSAQCNSCKSAELQLHDSIKTRQTWLLPGLEEVGSCLDAA